MNLKDRHIVLGVSGSISAYKSVEIVRELIQAGADVRVVMTASATEFVGPITFGAITGHPVALEQFPEQSEAGEAHIDLAAWADVLAVVPATAGIIGKAANGLADDLLSTILMACEAPCCFAPAMNFRMMRHPAVLANLEMLRNRGNFIIDSEFGPLANGEVGEGRLAEPAHIIQAITALADPRNDLAGRRVLISAGPTVEPIDPVRYITNRSSGKMGYAIARMAAQRGADVTLIAGPNHLVSPRNITIVPARTAADMHRAVIQHAADQDAIIMAAAVADYRPKAVAHQKIKKSAACLSLEMEKTTDILKALSERRPPVLVGFAVETIDGLANARNKLIEKDLDMIVYNDVTEAGAGFELDTNIVTVLHRDGRQEALPQLLKTEVADNLLTEVVELLHTRETVSP